MNHIVCYSGGHSSALVAIEVARRYGKEDTILLNHNIHASVEHEDIKRFKQEVADYLEIPITYANHKNWDTMDQFDVVVAAKAFKVGTGTALYTHRLKTEPFTRWLKENAVPGEDLVYYGFDKNESVRIQRRSGIMGNMGYQTDYPLAIWTDNMRTIQSTTDIGIDPPLTYGIWKHANCTGCLKASKQHWYATYCTRKDIFEKAKAAEDKIGYTIIKSNSMEELEPMFAHMEKLGVQPTEKIDPRTFWASVRKLIREFPIEVDDDEEAKPCECVI